MQLSQALKVVMSEKAGSSTAVFVAFRGLTKAFVGVLDVLMNLPNLVVECDGSTVFTPVV